MRDRRNTIAFALAALILLSSFTFAADQGQSTFWGKVLDKINYPARKYVEYTIGAIMNGLTYNPTLFCPPASVNCEVTAGMDVLINKWIKILIPFYAIAMLFTALFFILKAGTPRGRARARSMFLKLLLGTVIVALSPVIYQALLESSAMFVGFIWNADPMDMNLFLFRLNWQMPIFTDTAGNPKNMDNDIHKIPDRLAHTGLAFSCLFVYMAAIVMIFGGLMVWLRNMMVFFYGVFFPLICFFYMWEITKPQGQKWLNASLKWIYTPVLQALIMGFTIELSDNMLAMPIRGSLRDSLVQLLNNTMASMMVLAGIFSFCAAPMIVSQLMSWLGDVIVAVGLGSGRTWMVAAGGIMAGGGAGAIVAADANFTRGAAFERYMGAMAGQPESGAGGLGGGASMMGAMGQVGGGGGAGGGGGPSGGGSSPSAPARGGGGFGGSGPAGGGGGGGPAGGRGGPAGGGGTGASQSKPSILGGHDVMGGAGSGGFGDSVASKGGGGGPSFSGKGKHMSQAEKILAGGGGGGGGFSPEDVSSFREQSDASIESGQGSGNKSDTEVVASYRPPSQTIDQSSTQSVTSNVGKTTAGKAGDYKGAPLNSHNQQRMGQEQAKTPGMESMGGMPSARPAPSTPKRDKPFGEEEGKLLERANKTRSNAESQAKEAESNQLYAQFQQQTKGARNQEDGTRTSLAGKETEAGVKEDEAKDKAVHDEGDRESKRKKQVGDQKDG